MKDKKKEVSLNADVVKVPIGPFREMDEEELIKRINELFVKYCCGGIDKSEDEMPDYVKVCREVFANGYKAGYNDMRCIVTGEEWE